MKAMKIKVNYTPVEYEMIWGEFACLHADTHTEEFATNYMTFEGVQEYSSKAEVCDECNSWYNEVDEEWIHEESWA
jgi:hypothetical protein